MLDFLANLHPLVAALAALVLWGAVLVWRARPMLARMAAGRGFLAAGGGGLIAVLLGLFLLLGLVIGLHLGRTMTGFGTSLLLCLALVVLSPLAGLLVVRLRSRDMIGRAGMRVAAVSGAASLAVLLSILVWNLGGWPPLPLAVFHRHDRVARALLSLGASPDAANRHGETALGWAVFRRDADMVRLLLERGADPNRGYVLLSAVGMGDRGIVAALLAYGADVDQPDHTGRTVLMAASEAGSPEMVRMLLAAGASTKARDAQGETALDYARRGGRADIARILEGQPARTGR
ncbi:MAG: ankyrin repeat domain-containing protein [Deltaproteobacteria bacterium]|nr:ankyrin repeat domain-containing protein [Deltaproteobacteria bacterium]